MKTLAALSALLLSLALLSACGGAFNLQGDMTAAQIRATNGVTTCAQYDSLVYGSASFITMNADDTKKGATSSNNTQITCGKANMTSNSTAGVPVPSGSITTTTTRIEPVASPEIQK
jgi:hypothetical protein